MPESPAYVILGRGRWAQKMLPIISGAGKPVSSIEQTRQLPAESEPDYVERLSKQIRSSGAQFAWLCVAPGRHVSLMIEAAIEAGVHVIVEKPWYGSSSDTEKLQSLARQKRRLIAMHFEYLVLNEVEEWRTRLHCGSGLRLGGRFFLNRSDQSGIPAIDNLGCHLFAIREFAVPASAVSQIQCGYELPDERLVWLDKGDQRIASIDLFTHGQPIIQRFIQKVEAALDGAAFPFDLQFAMRVALELDAYKRRSPA